MNTPLVALGLFVFFVLLFVVYTLGQHDMYEQLFWNGGLSWRQLDYAKTPVCKNTEGRRGYYRKGVWHDDPWVYNAYYEPDKPNPVTLVRHTGYPS